jgi:hypothetical protein
VICSFRRSDFSDLHDRNIYAITAFEKKRKETRANVVEILNTTSQASLQVPVHNCIPLLKGSSKVADEIVLNKFHLHNTALCVLPLIEVYV